MLLVTVLLATSFISIYYAVWYLDKSKASAQKAAGTLLVAFIINNVALYVGVPRYVWGEWVVPIIAIAVGLIFIFKLKPLHVATVAGVYVACRVGVVFLLNFLPLEALYA